jgi:K+-sensing histidine kinase KdpD
VVFGVVLTAVAIALLLGAPTIFPWPLDPRSSVLFGWIFMGAMTYFIYAVLRPGWYNARGQLLGFLAYDLVLIVPFVQHFATVKPEHLLSLVIYLTVIVYSGLLAGFYLVANRATRRRPASSAAAAGK